MIKKPITMRRSRSPWVTKMVFDGLAFICAVVGVEVGFRMGNFNLILASLSIGIATPFLVSTIFHIFFPWRNSDRAEYEEGDRVVYFQHKHSTHPSPNACNVNAAEAGEEYDYDVEKQWVVAEVQPNTRKIICITARGKLRTVDFDDPRIHRASIWERFRYREKYRVAEDMLSSDVAVNPQANG